MSDLLWQGLLFLSDLYQQYADRLLFWVIGIGVLLCLLPFVRRRWHGLPQWTGRQWGGPVLLLSGGLFLIGPERPADERRRGEVTPRPRVMTLDAGTPSPCTMADVVGPHCLPDPTQGAPRRELQVDPNRQPAPGQEIFPERTPALPAPGIDSGDVVEH